MIEIKLVWIQIFAENIALWLALNFLVFFFNIFVFWGDDDQLKRTPLIATILWVGIVLSAYIQLFVKIVP